MHIVQYANNGHNMRKTILMMAAAIFCAAGMFEVNCAAQEKTDEEILSAIRERPYRAAACHSPYYAPEVRYTPAPKGYKAFYISHLGRHGSRFQTHGGQVYDKVVALLDSLHYVKALTPQGDSLRLELHHMQQLHIGKDGMLTRKGSAEHAGIASRLVARCPSVFGQKDRNTVYCTSTQYHRTIQSMAGFISGLKPVSDDLEFSIGCGYGLIDYQRPGDKLEIDNMRDSLTAAVVASLMPDDAFLGALRSRLFNGYAASGKVLFDIFKASASAGCLDIDVDPFRFFTPEELFAFYRMNDVNFNAKYGTLAPVRALTAKNGKAFLRRIVDDADKALEGNGHCADFRFAHDANVGPVMNLLGIGAYAYTAREEAPYRDWQSYSQICMGSNIQMEFYRNAKGDILVKALFNEREVDFPGLDAVNGVYYRWADVRRYMIGKCEVLSELPDYYDSYLEDKAAQIRELQKEEMEGFYFITDMHFPTNYGHSPAMIERLEKLAGNRLIVYGGDALTYMDEIDEAMAMQISALEQMRGASPILWTRGNHDFVNYTGKKEWIKGERKAFPSWDSAKLLSYFCPGGTVYNADDPYTAYCYYDNPGKKVRYVVFDSSDTVQDDNKMHGLSDTQLRWMIEEAILGAPKSYGLVFVSHRPFIDVQEFESVKDALSAFSTHSAYSFLGKTYDFSARKDIRMLCLICGHNHRDFSFQFPGGQPQINVTADCDYAEPAKKPGSVYEQGFEYVSISKDGHIRTVRIGAGEDRQF